MPYKDPQARREHGRRYRQTHAEELRAKKRQWFKEHWDSSEAFRAKYRTQVSAEASAAHQRVYNAIQRGEIQRPLTCSECGATGFIEAAHENYIEHLAIRWLCRPCHRAWDHAYPKGGMQDQSVARTLFPHTQRLSRQLRLPVPKWRAPLLDFACAFCGKAFQATAHDRRRTDTPCCSKSCGLSLLRAKQRAERAAQGIGVAECAGCGAHIERAPNRLRKAQAFCSKSCSMKYQWAQRRAG